MSLIPKEKYTEIIEILPILCVDVIIQNTSGEYLLIKRANEPKKGQWWPIGGRVLKGETLEHAVIRKIMEETAIHVKSVRPIGYFETVADTNPFGLPFQYHAVSVIFAALAEDWQQIHLDDQSTEWKYSKDLPPDFRINAFYELGSKRFKPGGLSIADARSI
jgi:colanic acid biosynthesis protein WcaH